MSYQLPFTVEGYQNMQTKSTNKAPSKIDNKFTGLRGLAWTCLQTYFASEDTTKAGQFSKEDILSGL